VVTAAMRQSGSPYADYRSAEAAPSYYREDRDARYSSYEDSYDPPVVPSRRRKERGSDAPHRRGRTGLSRSRENLDGGRENGLSRSRESLGERHRSFERLDRDDSYEVGGIDNRGLQMERELEHRQRRNRSYDDGLHSRIGSFENLGHHDPHSRRNKSMEQLDRRERSMEHLDRRNQSIDHLDRRERSIERGLDVESPSLSRNMERRSHPKENGERNMDRRHRSRSRENIVDPYDNQVVYQAPAPIHRSRVHEEEERRAASRAASEIYANTRMPRPKSGMSQYTYRSGRSGRTGVSDGVSVKTKTTAGGKLRVETMTAPHPCCPNTRSCCCLMILMNLALLLITLGFVVVLQLYEPIIVWYAGICMLIFGFLTMFGSMVYCVFVCREVEHLRPPPGELYWTNHWSKSVNVPEIHYSNTQTKPAADYRGSEFSYKTEHSHPSRVSEPNGRGVIRY